MTPDMECAGKAQRRRRFGSIDASATRLVSGNDDPKRCRRFALPPHSKCFAALLCLLLLLVAGASAAANVPQRKRTQRSRTQKPRTPPKPKIDYAKFSHT